MNNVRKFWDEQAATHGVSDCATAPDHYYRKQEIAAIMERLGRRTQRVLDIGCGNGFATLQFARAFPNAVFVGADYSAPMIDEARKARQLTDHNISFIVTDVRDLDASVGTYDTIICCRCLINLADWEEQQQALLQMKRRLNPYGRIILVENFMDGLRMLNLVRKALELHPIEVRWHNRYLEMAEFGPFVSAHFEIFDSENVGNMYYLVSRCIHAKLAQMEGREPAYDHPLNKIAAQLPRLGIYGYSPNYLYELHVAQ